MVECQCGKQFKNSQGLGSHQRYCGEVNPQEKKVKYNCSCGDEFINKGGFEIHKKFCNDVRNGFQSLKQECPICGLKIRNLSQHKNSNRCRREKLKQRRIENEKYCENCQENKVKNFGESSTGRFCSIKCARSYATKSSRKKISKKVSKTLSGRIYKNRRTGWHEKCLNCKEKFYTTESQNSEYCCWKCYLEDNKVKDEYKKYKLESQFDFSIRDYETWFNVEKIEKFGWYKPFNKGNNLNGVSLDHLYSIKNGFKNNVDTWIISHPANCQLLPHKENQKKHITNQKSLNEIKNLIIVFENLY